MPLIGFLLLLSMCVSVVHAQNPADRGRALVREFCSSCHAVEKTGRSPREGAPPFRTLGRSYDLDRFPRMLERGIVSGHPAMPEFKFKPRDARAVGAYLRSIQQ
jgi:mono/diheme cytochrome c family protein